MPRKVMTEEKTTAITLIEEGLSQREICKVTGLSRNYIRKLAAFINHKFPRNGHEIIGELCMCTNCGSFFRRAHSKIKAAKQQFCTLDCKYAFMAGPNHPMWKTGKTAQSFSSWVKNQSEYIKWRDSVLERDKHKCVISGETEELEAHHIMPKSEEFHPEKVFDIDNGLTLSKKVHIQIHQLISSGIDFHKAISQLKKEYELKKEFVNRN